MSTVPFLRNWTRLAWLNSPHTSLSLLCPWPCCEGCHMIVALVTKQSVFFTSSASDFNVMADWYMFYTKTRQLIAYCDRIIQIKESIDLQTSVWQLKINWNLPFKAQIHTNYILFVCHLLWNYNTYCYRIIILFCPGRGNWMRTLLLTNATKKIICMYFIEIVDLIMATLHQCL